MSFSKGLTRLVSSVGVFALLFGLSGTFAGEARAQNPPATFYGTASGGDVVEAFIDGVSCGSATADADGFWTMQVEEAAPCAPADGDPVTFTLNGQSTAATGAIWEPGGAPDDPAAGIVLTATGDSAPSPQPAATGNAGLLAGSGSGPWLALGLGVLALVLLAGARAVMIRRNR